MNQMKKVLLPALGIVALIIIFQNFDSVTLRLLFWKVRISQVILIPALLGLGFFAGFVWGKKNW